MKKALETLKETCQYVGVIAIACGSALILCFLGKRKNK